MIGEAEQTGLIFEPHLKNAIQPNAHDQQHNERKGIYLAREEHVRTISGPIHKSVKQRWEANTDNYRSKSKALARLLNEVGNDWSTLIVV